MTATYEAVLLGAGQGKRMASPIPKQFHRLAGKPLMVHVLELFESLEPVSQIYLTFLGSEESTYLELIEKYQITKVRLVKGGQTRQESVYNALQHVQSDRVIIHEVVRPFVPKNFILDLLEYDDPAVVPTIPIPFTVSQGGEFMTGELERKALHNIQLPQVFDTAVIKQAHDSFKHNMNLFTEDSAMVFRIGDKVRFVPGREENIKVTTPLDMKLAELLYSEEYSYDR